MISNPEKLKGYSPNELIILRGIGCTDKDIELCGYNPVQFLTDLGTLCWTRQIDNEYSEALKRAIIHIKNGKSRGNPEYEDLIAIPEEEPITSIRFNLEIEVTVFSNADWIANENRFPNEDDIESMVDEIIGEMDHSIEGRVKSCTQIK